MHTFGEWVGRECSVRVVCGLRRGERTPLAFVHGMGEGGGEGRGIGEKAGELVFEVVSQRWRMARVGDDVGWRWSGGARPKQRDQIGHRLKLVCAHPLYVRDRAAPLRSARRMVVLACVFVRARACECACDRVCACVCCVFALRVCVRVYVGLPAEGGATPAHTASSWSPPQSHSTAGHAT